MPRRKKVKGSSEGGTFLGPKQIVPKTKNQSLLLDAINTNLVVIALGSAGCGKTYLSCASAVHHLYNGYVKKIIISRPMIETGGRSMGALPGDLATKMFEFLVPIYTELEYFCPRDKIGNMPIDIVPLNFMRGRTFKDAFIIIDECQNASREDLITILSRFGSGSKMVLCGDPTQSDLPKFKQSGLLDIADKLDGNVDLLKVIRLGKEDIVRHEIVGHILSALGEI